jgi:methyltransferase-like protein
LARLSPEKTAEQFILMNEANVLRSKPDHLLIHDELSPVVHREWKWSFAAAARRHGLRVIGEAGWSPVQERSVRPEMQNWLEGLSPDPDVRAQCQDFLTLRRFREDILCRDDAPPTHAPTAARLMRVRFRSSLSAASEPNLAPGVAVEFRSDFGAALSIDGALTKAALLELGRAYPRSLSFDELFERVRAHATSAPDQERARLAQFLFLTIEPRLVEITTFDPPFARRDADHPLASKVARLQRQNGPRVTNLMHLPGEFAGERSARLLALLDGTRDRTALARELDQSEEAMERELAFLHRNGFLVDGGGEPERR